MKTAFSLLALAALAAAAPAAQLRAGTPFPPRMWAEVRVEIDPKGAPIALSGLTVVPAAVDGVEFEPAILPPPDAEGAYAKKFAIRLPLRVADGKKRDLTVAVSGEGSAGELFRIEAKGAVRAMAYGYVTGSAKLGAPARTGAPNRVVVSLSVSPDDWHVYGRDSEFSPISAELLGTGPRRIFEGGGPSDLAGAEIHGAFTMEIPFTPLEPGKVRTRVLVSYQACDPNTCVDEALYLPLEYEVEGEPVGPAEPAGPAGGAASAPDGSGSKDVSKLGLLGLTLAAIGAGLFALVMPCTYPMIPITISFFTKQAEARHGGVAGLALAYGGGIVAIFAAIGAVVGLGLGRADLAQWIATEWWVNAIFALLFIVFGLSLLGLFEIRLPAFLNDVAAKASGTGGYLSVFGMGMTLVVTSFTCTAPFVGTLLVWAGQGGSTMKVVYAMGVFGLTMAIPFVLLARSPDALRKIPRSGEWMNQLKVTMGILELGLALKFLSNIDLAANTFLIGRTLFLVLWGASFLAAALYLLGAFGGVSKGLTRGRALGAGLLLAFAAYLGYGLTGRPLGRYLEAFFPDFEGRYDRAFAAVAVDDYEAGLRLARERNLPIFLHFTGFQ